jgi:2-oxoglutarate dehydrogenase E1 component
VLTQADADDMIDVCRERLEHGEVLSPPVLTDFKETFGTHWGRFKGRSTAEVATAVPVKRLDFLGDRITTLQHEVELHPRVQKVLDDRRKMRAGELPVDWGYAEHLAYASLLDEGHNVRVSGQDSARGTFFHRHAVWHDQKRERRQSGVYVPLEHISGRQGNFTIIDSLLSEEAVLAFEYGYATADPDTLVVWEAQFGDFANGAQVVIDQFITSGEAKWGRLCGLTLLLPHGLEGQGPEHSSARLERYLQLCAQDNIQVCNITTPANYFHVLRRQMHRPFRKPLIIMTPKSLLRHPLAKSTAQDFIGEGHFMRILSDTNPAADAKTRRLVLCSGKVAYDLIEARDASGIKDTQIVRLEQLYPFPGEPLAARLARMTGLEEVVWCQEEPKNNGSWFFVEPLIEEALAAAKCKLARPRYAGRNAAASPATGLASRHASEQAALVADALGLSVRGEIRRRRSR